MTRAPEYSASTQAKLVCVTLGMYNFIRTSCNSLARQGDGDGLDGGIRHFQTVEGVEVEVDAADGVDVVPGSLGGHVSEEEKARTDTRWDNIVKAMWEDYVAYISN